MLSRAKCLFRSLASDGTLRADAGWRGRRASQTRELLNSMAFPGLYRYAFGFLITAELERHRQVM
jgi:hypothetical protein